MKKIVLFSLMSLITAQAGAAEMTSQRADVLSRADVWEKPSWMASDLSFSPSFNIKAAPQVAATQGLLEQNEVHCLMTQKYATQDRGIGKSPKFNCDLMKRNPQTGALEVVLNEKNKPVRLKVKYSIQTAGMPGVRVDSNPEVQAEVLAARLMGALGFTVDRMFAIKKLNCYGCSIDPWNVRQLDQSSLNTPRSFTRVSVEFKAEGDEILNNGLEGWSYQEVLTSDSFSKNPSLAREQLLEREALLLMGGFLQHSDNKPDNHKVLCEGKLVNGSCNGKIKLLIHDLGMSFGGGTMVMQIPKCIPFCSSKAELKRWSKVSMWWDEQRRNACTVNMGFNFAWKHPVITEEARLFVHQLLRKFAEGPAGYQRLIGLFESADLEAAGKGKPSDWAKVFIEKIEEIGNPALSDNNREPGDPFAMYNRETRADRAKDTPLHCEGRLDKVVQKILRRQN